MNAPAYIIQQEEEKKRKRKGLIIAFWFHVALIALAILPLMNHFNSPDPKLEEQMTYVTINFSEKESASNVKNHKKKAKKVEKKKKVVEKPVKKEVPKVKPAPAKKVITTPEPEPALEIPTETEEVTEEPVVEEPVVEEAPAEEPVEDPGTGSGEVEEVGEASDTGTDDEKASGGNADNGNGFGENAGDGIFNRKVIYRADVKKITKLSGKIVIDLCINQEGRVVYAKPVKGESTIEDYNVIRKAVNLTTKYKFERDYTAPKKQCGRMTYVFEGAGR